ncbi:DUF2063 domain-containing protein [Synechococcus sp. RSCCF101]|uniref:HvfC/BufC N-terminal domain-containing protein n=1 Tax=Synechococcus sp. RSCCF101 TaxID=2511069 RepID=UPI0012441636|nr:DNA-binding domain-containing protein [Synechococcus sp. RSCCF101]QEY32706.1 DUF2063 domain-containing protein [Synechococcus sp. RSCCF101]
MSLADLQQLFTAAALGRASEDDLARLDQHLQGSPVLPARQGIEAYRTSVAGKLLRSLEQIYPVCLQLVGPAFFQAMATAFLTTEVSHSPDLGDFGGGLPAFLAAFPPARPLPYLADVARLEWHWHRAFNAPDEEGLNLEALARVPPEQWPQLVFRLPAGSALIASDYPIHRIWQANAAADAQEQEIDLNAGGVHLFVWRDGHTTRVDPLEAQEWQLLEALGRCVPFGEICGLDVDLNDVTLASLLPLWVQRGWLCGFEVAGCGVEAQPPA